MANALSVHAVGRDVDAAELGTTLMHEHIFVLSPELRPQLPDRVPDDELVEFAVERLARAAAAGVRTIVDATIIGQGRDPVLLRRVAERSDVALVAATGVFVYDELPGYFRARAPRGPGATDVITEFMVRDCIDGIGRTGVRAGVLKATLENPRPTTASLRAIHAAAQAQIETGLCMITHTDAKAQSGAVLAEHLLEAGADPERVVIGHSGDTADQSYLRSLLDQGFVLGMDRFGYDHLLPDSLRLKTVAELCLAGYSRQLVLSQDNPCFIDYYQDAPVKMGPDGFGTDYTRMTGSIVPQLLRRGVTSEQIEDVLEGNPRRLLPAVRDSA